jgi:hypothetical protein
VRVVSDVEAYFNGITESLNFFLAGYPSIAVLPYQPASEH